MKSGIYKIVNIKTNKFYVGSAVNLNRRFIVHKSQLNRNIHVNFYLQNAWNKYSAWYFEFVILEHCEPEKLIEREQFYIDTLKPEYNLCPVAASPNLGKNIPEKQKLKISKSLKGIKRSAETRAKMSAWQIGRKMSDGARANMTLAKIGTSYRRLKTKWPCVDGCECKCDDCRKKRKDIKKKWDDDKKLKIFLALQKAEVVNLNV